MRYVKFQFRNFRGIRETSLELTLRSVAHRVVTLVGLNESGKTTVLEAIDLFYPTSAEEVIDVSPKQLSAWKPKDPFDLIPISARTNFGGTIAVSATVALEESDRIAIAQALHEHAPSLVLSDEPITITQEWRFSDSKHAGTHTLWPELLGTMRPIRARNPRAVSKADSPDVWALVTEEIRNRLPLIWYFPSELFDLPEEIVLTPAPDESPTNMFFRSLFQDILTSLGQELSVQTHVVDRARSTDSGDERALRQLLLTASREVTASVVQAWDEIFDRSDMTSRHVRIELAPALPNTPVANRRVAIRFGLEDADGAFAIHERSLGFRWFFVYLLVTKYRGQQRKNGSEMLFLFDEPASNLHPSAQGALLRSLARLSADAVIVFTTHSHHLVNPDWLASAYVVTNGEMDPSEVSARATGASTDIAVRRYHDFAAQSPSRSNLFQPILDVLDYRPSLLESVPRLVLVEGKSDYYLLRYYSTLLATVDRHRTINWTPGGGATGMSPVIRLYLGWGRNFVVLLDGDGEGQRAVSRYLDEFGPDVEGRIVTIDAAARNDRVTALESLLDPQDLITFVQLVSPGATSFKKSLFSRGVQEAVARKQKLALSAHSLQQLSAVCDYVLTTLDSFDSHQ